MVGEVSSGRRGLLYKPTKILLSSPSSTQQASSHGDEGGGCLLDRGSGGGAPRDYGRCSWVRRRQEAGRESSTGSRVGMEPGTLDLSVQHEATSSGTMDLSMLTWL